MLRNASGEAITLIGVAAGSAAGALVGLFLRRQSVPPLECMTNDDLDKELE